MGREPRFLGGPRNGERAERHESPSRLVLWVPGRHDGQYVWVQKHARYEWRPVAPRDPVAPDVSA